MNLRPYQETGADFLYEHDRAMILAPMGAGKTALTLTAMRDMVRAKEALKFLVLAPKRVATTVWPAEAALWTPELSVAVCAGTVKQRLRALYADENIIVANYDCLQWLAQQPALQFDGVVFDELTRLKNPSGLRFKALYKVLPLFRLRWGLTGSFTSNGLEDVFGQCKVIDEKLLGRAKGAFLQQYFIPTDRERGQWEPREGSLEAVMQRIKPAVFLLEPGEYKDKLPPLHLVPVRCDLTDRAPYEKMKQDLVVQFPTAQVVAANAAAVTQKLAQMSSGFVYHTRKVALPTPGKFKTYTTPVWFSEHKFDALDDLLAENQQANTLLVYQFEEELAELKRRYPHLQTIDGMADWNKGKVRLMAVHPKSAGHGLNLQTGGCHMVWLSLPWSLDLFEQTVGRLHRSGQRHDVWCYVLMTHNAIDERIWQGLHDKRALSDIALEALK